MKKYVIVTIPILCVGFFVYLYLSWALSARVLFPVSSYEKTINTINTSWGKPYEQWLALLPEGEPFEVTTFDNLQLKGTYFQVSDSSTCAIIMAHGWGSTWLGMIKYIPAFDSCNCDYVFYDHRAHGASDGEYATGGMYESRDLLAITDWVNSEKGFADQQIGWVGSSWGAATSIMAGADPRSVAFIVADAPFKDWYSAVFERGIREYGAHVKVLAPGVIQAVNMRADINFYNASPIDAIGEVNEPLLLMHSKGDEATASQQSVDMAQQMNKGNSQFHHLDWGNDHVKDVLNNTEEFTAIVYSFLQRHAPQVLK